jgi:FkbM family methyltransferase
MPKTLGEYNHYSGSAIKHIAAVMPHIDQCRVAVQAGGHAGQFPVALCQHFPVIYSYEPDQINYHYMVHNLAVLDLSKQVYTARGMLGSQSGTGFVTDHLSGGNRRRVNLSGPCPVYVVDHLNLPVCDLIYLDTEGSELDILKGSVQTIQRCRPVVAVEDRSSYNPPGTLADYLSQFGYTQVGQHSADKFFKCLN